MKKNRIKFGTVCILLFLLVSSMTLFGCMQNNQTLVNTPNANPNPAPDNNNPKPDSNLPNTYNNLDKNRIAKIGDTVSVHYMLWKGDMNYIQSTYETNTPFEVIIGKTSIIQGFENALIGMKEGEIKKIVLPPKEAYGDYDANKIITFDKNAFGNDFNKLWVGRSLVHPDLGPGKITKLTDSNAVIDFNPELAGQTLTFEIKMVSIKK